MKKLILKFWLIFVSFWGLLFVFFYGTAHWNLLGKMPSTEQLENPNFYLASEIYADNGELIGTFFTENRIYVNYSDIPPHLVNALISTEDKRFYDHSGIDSKGLVRAVIGAFVGGRGGASTITQQLSKMLFTKTPSDNIVERIIQKFKEWVMAVELERLYTKEEIATMYFNQFDFLHSAVGVFNASRVYFNKNISKINIAEAATLVGMFKSPTIYNPFKKNNSKAFERRNTILTLMKDQGFINENEYANALKIKLKNRKDNNSDTREFAAYFKENVRGFMNDWCKQNGYNLYKDGLKIYTSLNVKLQKNAEYAVQNHIKNYLQPRFEKEWKKRKNGPFYFMSDSEKEEQKKMQEILYNGMRQSARYRKQYYKQKDIVDAYNLYSDFLPKINYLEDTIQKLSFRLSDVNFELNQLVKKDTLKYFENDIIEILEDQKEELDEEIKDFQEDLTDLKLDAGKAYKAYEKLWLPFDEKMKKQFQKKVSMRIFTWEGSKKVNISPLDSIFHHKKFLRAGLCSIDPTNGQIKAWVGGINHKHFKYDHVKAKRQAGSSFKPIVYATALNMGANPETKIVNKEIIFKKGEYGIPEDWAPKNSGSNNLEYEFISLKTALAKSINWVAAQLIKGRVHNVVQNAKTFGITSNIPPLPSVCLGTADVSLEEMVSAYSTFANKGNRWETNFILKIEDKNGKVLYLNSPKTHKVISEQTANGMITLLQGNTESFKDGEHQVWGTGYRLRLDKPYGNFPKTISIAGKTGTTQNNSDGWYIGICNNLVTGVWVGCEDRSAHFNSGALGQGANMALPVWGYFMKRSLNNF